MILERRTTASSCFSSFSLPSVALRCDGIVQYERCVSVVSSACRGLHVVISGIIHRPPRRARTRCRVAPPSSWYSLAVLSSFLHVHIVSHALAISFPYPSLILYVHLLAAENEALLCWGNAFLLLDTLLDA